MAKTEPGTSSSGKTDEAIANFAEELGEVLGNAEAKAKSWLGQRGQIVKTLEALRDKTNSLLVELGHQAENVGAAVSRGRRRGRPPGSGKKRGPGRPKGSGKKKRTMSAAGRAKISAAQKKRWAAVKAGEKKK